ncbi:MAG TPA: hypothetical protein VEW94_02205, partial [Chloroflexia bacterium]|nr:hypothetical protein [Chloroflexia bacterium]
GANDGRGAGANQITADIARMVAQVPELFETLTGVKVSDMMSRMAGFDTTAPAKGAGKNNGADALPSRPFIEGTATPVPPKDGDTRS